MILVAPKNRKGHSSIGLSSPRNLLPTASDNARRCTLTHWFTGEATVASHELKLLSWSKLPGLGSPHSPELLSVGAGEPAAKRRHNESRRWDLVRFAGGHLTDRQTADAKQAVATRESLPHRPAAATVRVRPVLEPNPWCDTPKQASGLGDLPQRQSHDLEARLRDYADFCWSFGDKALWHGTSSRRRLIPKLMF